MRIVFFGTPVFAVPSLEALLGAGLEVVAVVTQPDRAQGRSHSKLVPPPVKRCAEELGLNVYQPERPRGDVFQQSLRALEPDLGVVVAYGHILRPEILEIPSYGMVNVHASLLPRWRGAAPIHWSILSGDTETGISIMRVEPGLDTGAVWLTERVPIDPTDTTGSLTTKLSELGAEALLEALPRIANNVTPMPQAENGVTHAAKVDRAMARIRWDEPAVAVAQRIRAMDPAPGAWTTFGPDDIKCFEARAHPGSTEDGAPGEVVAVFPRLMVAARDGLVEIGAVQPAGRRRIPADEWLRGTAIRAGERFR